MLDYSSVLVSSLLALIITVVTMFVATKRLIVPTLEAVFEEKYATAEGAIKKGMSAMGKRSGEIRLEKAMEREVSEHLLEEYPEIMAIAEKISPDLMDMIEEDPETALRLVDRYLPLLKKFFPDLLKDFGEEGKQKKLTYEF